jgi:hypothetical protein
MEVAGMKMILKRWLNDSKVAVLVQDKDSKISKLVRESGWKIEQKIDPNHAKKSFRRFWDSLDDDRKYLFGLKDRLIKWMDHIIYLNIGMEAKIEMWMNALNHYQGDHTKCPRHDSETYEWANKNNSNATAVLKQVLNKGLEIIKDAEPLRGSTQLNEAYHSVKAKFADKRISYLSSTELRYAMSIIAFDNQPFWQKKLRELLGIPPLPSEIEIIIEEANEAKRRPNENRRTPEYRKKANEEKRERTRKRNEESSGKKDYKPLNKKSDKSEKGD